MPWACHRAYLGVTWRWQARREPQLGAASRGRCASGRFARERFVPVSAGGPVLDRDRTLRGVGQVPQARGPVPCSNRAPRPHLCHRRGKRWGARGRPGECGGPSPPSPSLLPLPLGPSWPTVPPSPGAGLCLPRPGLRRLPLAPPWRQLASLGAALQPHVGLRLPAQPSRARARGWCRRHSVRTAGQDRILNFSGLFLKSNISFSTSVFGYLLFPFSTNSKRKNRWAARARSTAARRGGPHR